MNLVLVVNAGSSSLKYQLLNMDDESVIAKGNCDRIGIDGKLSHKVPSRNYAFEQDCPFPTHTEAFEPGTESFVSFPLVLRLSSSSILMPKYSIFSQTASRTRTAT